MKNIAHSKRTSLWPISLIILATFALIGVGVQISTTNSKAAADDRADGAPQYQIFDLGVVQAGDTASQGFGVSNGGVAVGRSFRTGATQAYSWTQSGGRVALPNLAGRNFAVANSANDNGIVVGTGATTAFGSGRLPLVWQNGVVSQLPLPAGETLGDANDVTTSGVAVGSVNAGTLQRAVIYSAGVATVITQTTATGCFFTTAFGINDSGRIVGQGIDPNNAARNVGIVYDMSSNTATEVGALPGSNGALAFGVSNSGFVTGSSMLNQGSGLPFRWSPSGGMVAVPLPVGTTQASGRGVNSAGWVVGTASSAFAIPFVWNGTTTYRLQDLIPANSGWDLSTNTSSSALGISDNGIIVGTGVFNGATRGYAMVPVGVTPTPTPSPTPTTFLAFGSTTYKQDESQSIDVTINRTGVTTGGTTAFLTLTSTRAVIGTAGCGTGADVINMTGNVINFNPGETSKTVTLGLCGDLSADTDETVNLTLTNVTPGASAPNSAVLTINDTANQFKNPAAISIIQGTAAGLYPSPIVVTGATTNAFRIRVTLYDFYSTKPDNLDVLLVGPNGAKYALVGDVGGPVAITEAGAVTLTLADYPNAVLPDSGPLATGIFKPTTCETPVTNFPAPAPAGPYVEPGCVVARTNAQSLYGNFAGVTANGTWNLYIRDDNGVARPENVDELTGELKGGWGIELLPSTATGIDISGRVLSPDGRGLRNATVTITDPQGNRRTATTGSFGYYKFFDVEAGSSVVMEVRSNRYRFSSRLVQVLDTITDLDFSGIE
ncbi:MAG: carboxypeptidase regulatory-like domain-containing protein [Acidobacteria bacterium]|nr:carboxypeptidase regulatory-like domain-containing protein [Acidobacteriota bacterium]